METVVEARVITVVELFAPQGIKFVGKHALRREEDLRQVTRIIHDDCASWQ
jgi:hypothetical protein